MQISQEEADIVSKWDNLSRELEAIIYDQNIIFQYDPVSYKQPLNLNLPRKKISELKKNKNKNSLNAFKNFEGKPLEQKSITKEFDNIVTTVRNETNQDNKSVQCNISQSITKSLSFHLIENKHPIDVNRDLSDRKLTGTNDSRDSKRKAMFVNNLNSKAVYEIDKDKLNETIKIKNLVKQSNSLDEETSKTNMNLGQNVTNDDLKGKILKILEQLPRFKGDKKTLKGLSNNFKKLIESDFINNTSKLNNISLRRSQKKRHKQAVIDHLQNEGLMSVQKATQNITSKIKSLKNVNKISAPTVTPMLSEQNFADKIQLKTPTMPTNIKSPTASIIEDKVQLELKTPPNPINIKSPTASLVETKIPFNKVESRKFNKTGKLIGDGQNKSLNLIDVAHKNSKEVNQNLFNDYIITKKENENLQVTHLLLFVSSCISTLSF